MHEAAEASPPATATMSLRKNKNTVGVAIRSVDVELGSRLAAPCTGFAPRQKQGFAKIVCCIGYGDTGCSSERRNRNSDNGKYVVGKCIWATAGTHFSISY